MSLLRLAAFATIVCASIAAQAQSNMRFLQDAPVERMTKEDLALMMRNSNEALARNADGETSGWTNPKTGASGTATPLRTFTQKGTRCRETEYTNHAGGLSGGGRFTLCRQPSGEWKIVS
jgi:surface antigen